MKKNIFLFAALIGTTYLVAQTTGKQSSVNIPCSGFYETIPLRDMPLQTQEDRNKANEHHEELEERREAKHPKFPGSKIKHSDIEADPVVQAIRGKQAITTAPLVNFDGGSDNGSCPNDPNGAVGPSQFVQSYNSSYSVYNKTGKLLKGPVDLKSLFKNIPGDDGDPVVLYDKFADRWFISEFQVSNDPCGFDVAISETNDATGSYYVYEFTNAAWTANGNYPDYPKYSIWSDGYYVTANLSPPQVMVLDRTRMLAGKTSAGMIVTNYNFTPSTFGDDNSLWNDPKTFDCDASALPPYGTPNYLVFFQNVNSGGASNMIIIDQLVHDTAAQTLTINQWDSLAPAAFNDFFNPSNFATLAQPGVASFSGNAVDALDGAFNFRVPYLVFTGYNSVVLSNTVNTGNTVAGIRWYELRQDPSSQHFSIYQQGTYAPNDGINRWNGSIAMDKDGDIALAYSIDDSLSLYGQIAYTGRAFNDPPGVMTGIELSAVVGTKPAISCASRWGDYSDMTVDTDGVTFWHTNQYDKAGHAANRVFSFRLTGPQGVTNLIDLTEFKVYQDGEYLNVIANKLPSDNTVQVDLFDISGKQISTRNVTPAGNAIDVKLPVNGLAEGAYFVRMGNLNYQRVVKVIVK
ncbi:MAG TPA: T9SS type A sorting domain-containing protein [Bacteroidia bacterium]|nr:T9SS type A sorting domain-containing protein [Bacteroidia bacterium]